MIILKIVGLSLGSILVLFIVTKISGNREISQLTMFDYIIGITIGSIAAEMATSLEDNFVEPLTALIVYGITTVIISLITSKSIKSRRIISGESKILYDNGVLYKGNFKDAKFDLSEFLMECRYMGFFNLSDIQTALLEANGKISIIPVSTKRPLNLEDMNITPKQEKIIYNVILDGEVMKENLKNTGNTEEWLQKQIRKQGFNDFSEIFLGTCDSDNKLSLYANNNVKNKHDIFN